MAKKKKGGTYAGLLTGKPRHPLMDPTRVEVITEARHQILASGGAEHNASILSEDEIDGLLNTVGGILNKITAHTLAATRGIRNPEVYAQEMVALRQYAEMVADFGKRATAIYDAFEILFDEEMVALTDENGEKPTMVKLDNGYSVSHNDLPNPKITDAAKLKAWMIDNNLTSKFTINLKWLKDECGRRVKDHLPDLPGVETGVLPNIRVNPPRLKDEFLDSESETSIVIDQLPF